MKKLLLFVPFLVPLAACDVDLWSEPECDVDQQAPAVSITVLDATTLGPLPVEGVATVSAEGRRESRVIPANDSTPLHFFQEREGDYDAVVEAEGYESWDTTGLRVRFEGCVVNTAELRPLMQPVE